MKYSTTDECFIWCPNTGTSPYTHTGVCTRTGRRPPPVGRARHRPGGSQGGARHGARGTQPRRPRRVHHVIARQRRRSRVELPLHSTGPEVDGSDRR